ncbi:MAG TPA: hypothetical protein VGA22_00285 [Gemmatimonadales bacterium]|jgi:5,10-methylenetetrahydrofolate reductase
MPASRSVLDRLHDPTPLVTVELRPPRSGLTAAQSMDTWIDMYHGLRRLARGDTLLFLTDNAVGQAEEENLNHLAANLAGDVPPARVIPFLTSKHTLDYCLMYAARAAAHGFEALTVLGGDRTVGPPRCVPHAFELRRKIRARQPSLILGGWANPHRDAAVQASYLQSDDFTADFFLTQVVSHHSLPAVERFVEERRRRGVTVPGVFGVFYYRSATARTLQLLHQFFPVPAEGIMRDFAAGLSADEICARTILALRDVGADKVYLSNLGFDRPDERYRRVMELVQAV